jgi:hypothetical protein
MTDHSQPARPPALNDHQTDHSRPERAAPEVMRATGGDPRDRSRPIKPPPLEGLPAVIFPLPNVPVARLTTNNPGDHSRPIKPPPLEGQNKG